MAEETQEEGTEVDESLMSAGDMIAREIEKTSDAVKAEEGEGDSGEKEEEGKETGTEDKGEGGDPKGTTAPRTFTAFTGDKESEDYKALDGLTVKFRANQMDKELTVSEMVREVQKAAGIANALKNRTQERDDTHQKLSASQEELEKASSNGDLLLKVLQDEEAYKELKAKYLEAGGSATPTAPVKGAAPAQEDVDPGPDPHMEAGRTVVEEFVLPFSQELAEAYGADAKEIAQEIIGLAGETPGDFFTEEVMADIVNNQIPARLVESGFALQEGKTAPNAGTTENWFSGNGDVSGYGIQKKGSAPRGQTETETKLEARIKELESQVGGKGKGKDPDPEKDLDSVSGGPGDEAGKTVESDSGQLDLEGADSVSDIMKRLQAFEG